MSAAEALAQSSPPEMSSTSLAEILDLVDGAGIEDWLDGGLGVDALLGAQTRPHKDVDLVMRVTDVPRLLGVLCPMGFVIREGRPPNSFVLGDTQGREIDVHAVTFDPEGNGVYRMQNGKDWIYPAAGFAGRGVVGRQVVRCLSADVQVLCHAYGYTPVYKDMRDMALLEARLGVSLPPHLRADGAWPPPRYGRGIRKEAHPRPR